MKANIIGKPWDRPALRCEIFDCPRQPKLYMGGFWICSYHEDKFYDYQRRQLMKQHVSKSVDIFTKEQDVRTKKNKKKFSI